MGIIDTDLRIIIFPIKRLRPCLMRKNLQFYRHYFNEYFADDSFTINHLKVSTEAYHDGSELSFRSEEEIFLPGGRNSGQKFQYP